MTRVLCIGFDGATFDLIEPWVKQGYLPNFKKFMEEGTYCKLKGLVPTMSFSAWTSLATGVNPGKHNIFDYIEDKKDSYDVDLVSSENRKCKAIWNYLNDHNKKAGIINMPATYPAEKLDGFMISGMLAPDVKSEFTYPEELKEELLKKVEDYKIDTTFSKKSEENFLKEIDDMTDARLRATLYLMKEKEWDFILVVFTCLDRIQHFLWAYMDETHPQHKDSKFKDALLNYYKKLDEVIGKLSKEVREGDVVIVLSDHGFGPLYKNIYINTWLMQNDLLTRKKGSGTRSKFIDVVFKVGYKLKLDKVFKKIIPLTFLRRKVRSVKGGYSEIDWSKTKAAIHSIAVQDIKINLKGREPEGIVEEKDYEKLREDIIKKLYDLEDDGKKIIKKAYKKEELYKGPYAKNAASDIIIEPVEGYEVQEGFSDNLIENAKYSGRPIYATHRINGIFLAKGKNIKKGEIKDISILDVTPTILSILDVPLDKNFDGKVIDVFSKKKEAKYLDKTDEEKEKVRDIIKKLRL